MAISCFIVKNKVVSAKSISGHIISLGQSAAEILIDEEVAVHSNVKIIIEPHKDHDASEFYAKVSSIDRRGSAGSKIMAGIEFTSFPQDILQ